eukprot:tig00020780_g13761.t1
MTDAQVACAGVHRRFNPLAGRWVLCSPHRCARPWQGAQEARSDKQLPEHDPKCYLCPGNVRANGESNPAYKDTFVFVNDFAALLPHENDDLTGAGPSSDGSTKKSLMLSQPCFGICKVICFSPRHDLTLAKMSTIELQKVVHLWIREFEELRKVKYLRYIQIFENKGEMMGCSNPHPHGQIWSLDYVPEEPAAELNSFAQHRKGHSTCILCEYVNEEKASNVRIIFQNEDFVAVVPFWAVWPYEILVVPANHMEYISQLSEKQIENLAILLGKVTKAYDHMFETSFPYSMGLHQAPVNSGESSYFHWHIHFYPPLLRSATVKKFMVGFELLGEPQRDLTPEQAADRIRNCVN